MNIVCVGGGPAGLYFSLLAKKRHPDWNIHIFERNPPNDTWGFGIVFSDDTMSGFRDADPETYEAFAENFNHWDDIHIHYKGEAITSTGHGFAGMDRLTFLQILENRASELGVTIEHNREILTLAELPDADLIVSCEGVKSFIRREHGDAFGLDIEVRPNRYIWFGTDKPFDAFTFHFKEDRHGLFRSHCYQYMSGGATFIVECTEETWRRVGLDEDDEQGSIDYCARLFEEELGGHQLVSNESRWRSFPVITNQHYFHRNMVLLGDSLHTAHFSIGSGTKLAMEDAIALADGLDAEPKLDNALRHFQDARKPAVDSLQRAARVSMEWFEETERYFGRMVPLQFAFSLLTRSLRITHDNLKSRDPELIERIDALVAETAATQTGVPRRTNPTPPPIFTPYRMRDMVLENRIAVSPMCMYSAEDGTIGDWHLVHLGSRAMGGAGLIMGEGTGISPDGRITPGCAGLYKDAHVGAWRRVVDFVHAGSAAKIGIQLCHAGRKASTKLLWEGMDEPLDDGNWPIIAPSALPYGEHNQVPREMTRADMDRVRDDFVSATERAEAAGFDLVELHCAHGYLLSSFLSPRTNRRDDDYGGSIENRMRYPLEVFRAMRRVWPQDRPMSVRISATDWVADGLTLSDAVAAASAFHGAGCDIVDVSAGQVVADQKPRYGRLFQTPFAEKIRLEAAVPTMTVGNIQSFADANSIIAGGRADICVLARMHLFDPYWTRHAANALDYPLAMPNQYKAVEVYNPRWQ